MNQETGAETQDGLSRRANAARRAFAAAFLFALVFLAAWPWEIFQRVLGGLTLALVASAFILGLGLIREAALFPRRIRLPKGVGLPIALIALACLQSALHSADPAASKALVIKYVWYLLLFGMAAPLFSRPGAAVLAWRVFAVSAGLVGVYAVCCAAGWLTPALAGTHEYFGRRLTEDVRVGAFVRIAATTPDYNQAILPTLTALPFLLAWAASSTSRRAGRVGAAVLALFVVAGVAVSFSRSGLLAVAAVFMSGGILVVRSWLPVNVGQAPPPVEPGNRPETDSRGRLSHISDHGQDIRAGSVGQTFLSASSRRWRLGMLVGLVVLALFILVLLAFGGYADMLVRRALRGFNSPDPSYRSRLYVFGLAFKLLPKYALFGCGIGASGATLGAVAEPGRWMGTAIHSMPLMMWFETGILGLAAYFWLWWSLVRRVWSGLVHSSQAEQRRLGMAALGSLGVLFWMTAIQPFQELSLFPLLAALIVGSTGGTDGDKVSDTPARSRRWHIVFACAMALVVWVVTNNITTYQNAASDVAKYAAALENGFAAEQRGDWETAHTDYERAESIGRYSPHDYSAKGSWLLSQIPYYQEACRAADLEFIFLRLPGRGGPPNMPYEVANFCVARSLWNAGETEQAMKGLGILSLVWPEANYAVGEMKWQLGKHDSALEHWKGAYILNNKRKPFPPLEYPFDAAPSMDDVYQKLDAEAKTLAESTKPADVARRVALLLRLGHQEEAVDALEAAPADAPELAVFRAALKLQ